MGTIVIHQPFSLGDAAYAPGDVVRGAEAQAILDHHLLAPKVSRVPDDAFAPQQSANVNHLEATRRTPVAPPPVEPVKE